MAALVSCLLALALAAHPADQLQTSSRGRTLLATVVDGRGRTLVDLDADDFVIDESGSTREVLDVHVADYPVVVLIDDQESAATALPSIRSAALRFIERIGQRPIAIATLTRPATMVASFEDDRADVLSRVEEISPNVSAAAMPLPAIANAVRLIRETGATFSAIVILSAAAIDASQPVEGGLLPSVVESGAAVHVIASRSPDPAAIARPQETDLLRVLADQTHGQYTAIFTAASYAVALDRLADRLSAEMMVDYLVPRDAPAGDVRAGVRVPGARVIGLGVR
jgi:hypothetical protein